MEIIPYMNKRYINLYCIVTNIEILSESMASESSSNEDCLLLQGMGLQGYSGEQDTRAL